MDHYTQSMIGDWVVLFTTVAFSAWIVYLVAALIRRRQQSVMQKHLLDKFATAQDFAEFMQSPAGQKYVTGFTDTVTSPRNSILSSIRTGCVLMFLGMGCLAGANGGWLTFRIGWVSFLVGIGFLVSSGVSYLLIKKAGWKEQE
jgi:hypothetical protein